MQPRSVRISPTVSDFQQPPRSLPALGAAMRAGSQRIDAVCCTHFFAHDPLVPLYQVAAGTCSDEADSAAQVVENIAERLRRLASAYEEWSSFDASAYFDLSRAQAGRLVQVVERVNSVHVAFFVDPLLPSFQVAESFWLEEFGPALAGTRRQRHHANPAEKARVAHSDQIQSQMIEHWRRANEVIGLARERLQFHVGYLAMNESENERSQWQRAWRKEPIFGLNSALTPDLCDIPSLTLALDFPLPSFRQSGRMRRLRFNRRRDRWRRARGRRD